ncbi:MAG TPA: NUDIX hydrolase [Anaerolineae bacterium]|nr:NUDIX hydrolase [Anaerolineae bacterium]HNU02728.1 NUDIX hydrolase [Anaerolineae bacterium]
MITFTQDNTRFNCRVVGVAIDQGRVLLHKAEDDDFWALPGGRAELLEPATATLHREMIEELHIEVDVGRLLWLVENFFQYRGLDFHELGLYFLMHVPADWPRRLEKGPFLGYEQGVRLVFQWFPLEELPTMRVNPSFLARGLQQLPAGPQHVVHVDP